MNPPSYDIMQSIDNGCIDGFDFEASKNLFCGEWGEPDVQVLVLDGAIAPSELKASYESISIQILVRGDKNQGYLETYRMAKGVSNYILSLPESLTINCTCYTGFEEQTNIAPLGKDESQRHIYSMNFYGFRNRE